MQRLITTLLEKFIQLRKPAKGLIECLAAMIAICGFLTGIFTLSQFCREIQPFISPEHSTSVPEVNTPTAVKVHRASPTSHAITGLGEGLGDKTTPQRSTPIPDSATRPADTPAPPSNPPQDTQPQMPTQPPVVTVITANVNASGDWQGTGFQVPQGATVQITVVSGQWDAGLGGNGGQGGSYVCANYLPTEQCTEPIPSAPQDALIGRIGGQLFTIGGGTSVSAQSGGELQLRINDDPNGLAGNSGTLTVSISFP